MQTHVEIGISICPFEECANYLKPIPTILQHIRKHIGYKPFLCQWCPYSCISEILLDWHIKKSHLEHYTAYSNNKKKGPQYTCDICPNSYFFQRSLAKHKKTHKHITHQAVESNSTTTATTSTADQATFEPCDAIQTKNMITCPVMSCGRKLKNAYTLQQHISAHWGYKPYICPHSNCSFQTTTSRNIKKHITNLHRNGAQAAFSEHGCPYICKHCNAQYPNLQAWATHIKAAHINPQRYRDLSQISLTSSGIDLDRDREDAIIKYIDELSLSDFLAEQRQQAAQALQSAIRESSFTVVQWLLTHNSSARPELLITQNSNAVELALELRELAIARLLLEKSQELDSLDTIIAKALSEQNIFVFIFILDVIPSAFEHIITTYIYNPAAHIMTQAWFISLQTDKQVSLLHEAISNHQSMQVVQFIAELNPELIETQLNGYKALHKAHIANNGPVINYLIKQYTKT